MQESMTYGSGDFIAAMKGRVVSSHVPGEQIATGEVGGSPSEEFARFEELTGRLVTVPKEELDEKRSS